MDTNKDKNEFLNNLCKNSDSEDNEDVTWNQQDNFIDNQSNPLKNKQMNNLEQNQNSKVTSTLPNQDDIIPAFKKMNIRETSATKNKPRSKDLALNYYFGVGERQSNQNGTNEDPFELSSTNNNNKQQDATTYMQFNRNNFFQQNAPQQQQQSSLPINTNTNNTSQQLEQELLNDQQQQQSNFTSLFNVNDNSNNNNNNNQQSNSNSIIEKYNVNSQPYIPKNKDLNFYKNAQLLPQQSTPTHPQLQPQHQLLPNTHVDNQLYKLHLSKSSNIPGKFYVIKSVDEANIIRVRLYIYLYTYSQLVLIYGVVQ